MLFPTGKYSLNPPSTNGTLVNNCKVCPNDKAESCNGANIIVRPGFWRENNLTDLIISCDNSLTACVGKD